MMEPTQTSEGAELTHLDAASTLLVDVQDRTRQLDRDVALHHTVVRRVLAELDAQGPSEAGDVIHSLLWHSVLLNKRADRFAQEIMASKAATSPATKKRTKRSSAPGVPVPPGLRFSPKVGDRFIASMSTNPSSLLYCEVEEKISANEIRCVVNNGGWYLTFNSKGMSGLDDPAIQWRVVLLLPARLPGVRSMDDYERVLAVAQEQLKKQALV